MLRYLASGQGANPCAFEHPEVIYHKIPHVLYIYRGVRHCRLRLASLMAEIAAG